MKNSRSEKPTRDTVVESPDSVYGGNELLLRFFRSEWFTAAICIAYLARYNDNIGISHYLCNRLLSFPISEVEFYIPQLCHLLVSQPSTSTALELLLLETSAESQHIAIRMQFIFQNYLSQFALTPTGDKYKICQDMYNRILSAQRGTIDTRFREHIGPASIVVGGVVGAIGLPMVMGLSAGIAQRQSRRERIFEEEPESLPLHRSRSMSVKPNDETSLTAKNAMIRATTSASFDVRRPLARNSAIVPQSKQSSSATHFSNKHSAFMSRSSPSLQPPLPAPHRPSTLRAISPSTFTDENITQTLQAHYYSTQTQFLQCLQDISLRLRLVPKAARQSALRIELSGLDKWLPADVCLANICHYNDSHDRIVQIVESECTILNSAERVPPSPNVADKVPYLLLVEVLRGDLTFSPNRPRNRKHFKDIMTSNPSSRQFDLISSTTKLKQSHDQWANDLLQEKSSEGEDGDLGLRGLNDDVDLELAQEPPRTPNLSATSAIRGDVSGTPGSRPETPNREVESKIEAMEVLTAHIRSAATMLAQLNSKSLPKADAQAIRVRLLNEMSSLEEQRLALSLATEDNDTSIERTMVDKEDPSAAVFAEDWNAKRERIRKASAWGALPGWDLSSVIVKSDAEMEEKGSQLISGLKRIWEHDKIDVWLRQMNVLVTSSGYGLIETITGAMSIHSIKKSMTSTFTDESGRTRTKYGTLKDHYTQKFGAGKNVSYSTAQMNFIRSLAGYSIATYVLNLKDRHNGNILIDEEGHLVHIDFGFFLSNSPGHGMGFEMSPFKLTADYLLLIGPHFPLFTQLLKAAFLSVRRHVDEICVLIELLQKESNLPCFGLGDGTVAAFRARLKLELRDAEAESFVDVLIERSKGSAFTRGYDLYQALVHGIRP